MFGHSLEQRVVVVGCYWAKRASILHTYMCFVILGVLFSCIFKETIQVFILCYHVEIGGQLGESNKSGAPILSRHM